MCRDEGKDLARRTCDGATEECAGMLKVHFIESQFESGTSRTPLKAKRPNGGASLETAHHTPRPPRLECQLSSSQLPFDCFIARLPRSPLARPPRSSLPRDRSARVPTLAPSTSTGTLRRPGLPNPNRIPSPRSSLHLSRQEHLCSAAGSPSSPPLTAWFALGRSPPPPPPWRLPTMRAW